MGKFGYRWANTFAYYIEYYKIKTFSDYGAEQQALEKSFNIISSISIRSYVPNIDHFSETPTSVELLTCTDVLENIEPYFIDDALNHIKDLTNRIDFLVVPTGPASKFLANGKNAHLI